MKTILVPTDFSENAVNALYYAIEMAKAEKAKLILLHVYHMDYANQQLQANPKKDEITEAEKRSDKQLKGLFTKVAHAGKVKCEMVSKLDLAVDGILATAEEKNVDLIIMGTKGASGLGKFLFGSNTASVIEKASCPVIAVPEGATYQSLKKITYATDYHASDLSVIKQLAEMADPLKAQITILHIYEKDEAKAKEEMTRFELEIGKKINYENISYQVISGSNTEEALEKYLKSEATDLLVLCTHKRDSLDKLFGSSITKKLAYQTKVPLMAFHYKNKESIMII